jgi:hypothetical protein
MTPKEFAMNCGCVVFQMTPEQSQGYGGRWAYRSLDKPNCSWCGFRTEEAAYKGFLEGTFGAHATKALLKLLKKTEK